MIGRIRCSTIPCLLAIWAYVPHCAAQLWQWDRTVAVAEVDTSAHVSIAVDSGMVAVAISTAQGGTVQVRARHQGGQDQWNDLFEVNDTTPWFGWSVALRNKRLTIGSPQSNANGPNAGEVHMYQLDIDDPFDPVIDLGPLNPAVAAPGDLFGYAQCWAGDTLVISAPGRSFFRATGAVFLFAGSATGASEIGTLAADPLQDQIPFVRWFGGALASTGDRLAIASPFSGFEPGLAQQNIGSLHLFQRDANVPEGWARDTVAFDPSPDTASGCDLKWMELGRAGMFFADGDLVLDHSARYAGVPGVAFGSWLVHQQEQGACPECGLRILDAQTPGEIGSAVPLVLDSNQYRRAFYGWSAFGDRILLERFDPIGSAWSTAVHARDTGGIGMWGVEQVLPELEPCDDLRGPIACNSTFLVRTSLRRDPGCGVPAGSMRVELQIYLP
ncbi:MAG: hypothetical protein IPK99_11715 [Flavobacteriales bacterium]|nr:hypothetical protein [Flavobacteriales bacterium]